MGLTALTPAECLEVMLRDLGLTADAAPGTVAATSLRRAASFLAPVAPRALLDAVESALRPLPLGEAKEREALEVMLEQLVAYGDLLEAVDNVGGVRRMLYLAAPSFVLRADGSAFLMGIRPDDEALVGTESDVRMQPSQHVRWLAREHVSKIELLGRGIAELTWLQYLRAPKPMPAEQHLRAMQDALEAAARPGVVDGLQVLDPSASVRYYRGRWKPATKLSGDCVARRPQAFGAPLWCFVRLNNGTCTALLDLPVAQEFRPCDEAWRLQAAIDATRGKPQPIRVRRVADRVALDTLAPLPRWLQRRWDLTGVAIERTGGALTTHLFDPVDAEAELEFASTTMWCHAVHDGSIDA